MLFKFNEPLRFAQFVGNIILWTTVFLLVFDGRAHGQTCNACGEGPSVKLKFSGRASALHGKDGELSVTIKSVKAISTSDREPDEGVIGVAYTYQEEVDLPVEVEQVDGAASETKYEVKIKVEPGGSNTDWSGLSQCSGNTVTCNFELHDGCGWQIEILDDWENSPTSWRVANSFNLRYSTVQASGGSMATAELSAYIRLVKISEEDEQEGEEDDAGEEGTTYSPEISPESKTEPPLSGNTEPVGSTPAGIESRVSIRSSSANNQTTEIHRAGSLVLKGAIGPSLAEAGNLRVFRAYGDDLEEFNVIWPGAYIRQVKTSGNLTDVKILMSGGFEVRKYISGQFGDSLSAGEYPVYYDSDPSPANKAPEIVRYEPIAAGGGHFGGVKITTFGANGSARLREVVKTSADGRSWRVTRDGLEVSMYNTYFEYSNYVWYRTDIETVSRDGSPYSHVEKTYGYPLRWITGPDWITPRQRTDEMLLVERVSVDDVSENDLVTTYTPVNTTGDGVHEPAQWAVGHVTQSDGSWVAYRYTSIEESPVVDMVAGVHLAETLWPHNGLPASPSLATSTNSRSRRVSFEWKENLDGVHWVEPVGTETKIPSGAIVDSTSRDGVSDARPAELFDLLESVGYSSTWRDELEFSVQDRSKTRQASAFESITEVRLAYRANGKSLRFLRGLTFADLDPEGNGTVFGYERGSYNSISGVFISDFNPSMSDGGFIRSTELSVVGFDALPVMNEATKQYVIRDLEGRVQRKELWILDDQGSWSLADTTVFEYPSLWANGSPKEVVVKRGVSANTGRIVSRVLEVSGTESKSWDEYGIETITTRDLLGRVTSVTQKGNGFYPDVVSSYAYNGRTMTLTTIGGGLSRTSVRVEDLAGRISSEISPAGALTSTTYPSGGAETLITYPGGLTRHEVRNASRQVVSISGPAVVDEKFSYETIEAGNGKGNSIVTRRIGNLANSPRYTITERDWQGRLKKITSPSPTGAGEISTSFSYAPGTRRLVFRSSPDGLMRFQKDDPLSAQTLSGYDLDNSLALEVESIDRVTSSHRKYQFEGGFWWRVSKDSRFDVNGTSSAIVSETKHCLHGNPNGLADWTVTTLSSGGTEEVQSTIDRSSKTLIQTTISSSSTNNAVAVFINGRLYSQTGHDSTNPKTWEYDALGQQILEVSGRGAETRKTYYPDGALESIADHFGNVTQYSYYGPSHVSAGKLASVTNPQGETTTYTYSDLGKVNEVAGTAAYKLSYDYDDFGDMEKLYTWRDATTSDVTQWIYQPGTGLVLSKKDAQGESTDYSYFADGKVHVRTWARGVSTTYTYSPAAGDLTNIVYSDSTPDVTFSGHDRLGRPSAVSQVGVGSETLSYHPGRGALFARYYESNHSVLPGNGIRYSLPDASGRATAFIETSGANVSEERTVSYGYDPVTGNLSTITDGAETHSYGYHPDSTLISTIHSSTSGTAWFQESRHYDAPGRLTGIRSDRVNGATQLAAISTHSYDYDSLNRRTRNTFQDGSYWEYVYNDRSEVTSATRRTPSGSEVAPLVASYAYDGIGNRVSSDSPVLGNRTYLPNSLNQYATITTGNQRSAVGRAPAEWSVEVNGVAASRIGELYHRSLTADNSVDPVWKEVITERDTGTPTMTNHFWFAEKTFAPSYDEDGNLTNDGRWLYSWDAENRLIQMESTSDALSAGQSYTKLNFVYDWQGRRLARHVWQGGTMIAPVFKSSDRWLYEGWNVVTELEATSVAATPTRKLTFTWGIDLSGTLQGAGGVGGLLVQTTLGGGAIERASYDGNGNIVAWTKSGATTPTSRYEYDAFGNTVVSEGNSPSEFGFSTKVRDVETGLYYYGYRYYDPVTGRWPSRDPIGERGGLNLYGFVGNDGVMGVDISGLARYEYDSDGFHVHAECKGKKLTYAVEFGDNGTPEFRAKNGHGNEFDEGKARKHWSNVGKCRDEMNKVKDVYKDAYDRMKDKEKVKQQGRNMRRFRNSGGSAVLMGLALVGLADQAQGAVGDYSKAVEKGAPMPIQEAAQKVAELVDHNGKDVELMEALISAAEQLQGGMCPCEDSDCVGE